MMNNQKSPPMNTQDISKLFDLFIAKYNVEDKNAIWQSHSQRFRDFWNRRIMTGGKDELNDAEIGAARQARATCHPTKRTGHSRLSLTLRVSERRG
jgi:hypothetical protein